MMCVLTPRPVDVVLGWWASMPSGSSVGPFDSQEEATEMALRILQAETGTFLQTPTREYAERFTWAEVL